VEIFIYLFIYIRGGDGREGEAELIFSTKTERKGCEWQMKKE
jgi:hypothetical protein